MRLLALFVWMLPFLVFGQASEIDTSTYVGKVLSKYEQNIKLEYINDVYIPVDMEDAYIELERLASPEALAKFKAADEKVIASKLHFGLGKWIMVNWNLYEGSRFSHYLKMKGVTHPDDMIQYVIVSFHRHMKGIDEELEQRAKMYQKKRSDTQKAIIDSAQEIGRRKKKN